MNTPADDRTIKLDRENAPGQPSVSRPWGRYTVLEHSPGFKVKRIDVHAGASLSLQYHAHRSEHWIVVAGTLQIENGDLDLILGPGEHTYVPAGQTHRLTNPGKSVSSLIEVQCGSYLGEDDIVRLADQYGRVT